MGRCKDSLYIRIARLTIQETFENVIIFENIILLKTYRRSNRDCYASWQIYRKPTCLIGDLQETKMSHRRPNRDQHVSSETYKRPTCLIGDLIETTCLIVDLLETNMYHRRPTRDQHVSLETYQRPTCLIRNIGETVTPHHTPINYRWKIDLSVTEIPQRGTYCRPKFPRE